jgi:hypothetical protein
LPKSAAAEDVLVVSPDVMQCYEEYKRRKKPLYLAVSADGLYCGYVYCPEYRCDPTKNNRQIAIDQCVKAGGRNCRIFAVGADIEVEYRVGDASRMTPPSSEPCVLGTPPVPASAGPAVTAAAAWEARLRGEECSDYRHSKQLANFKAFATTDPAKTRTAWGWSFGYSTVEAAIERAMQECTLARERESAIPPCQLFSLGGIVVYGMTEAERQAAIGIYRKKPDATNADLPPRD